MKTWVKLLALVGLAAGSQMARAGCDPRPDQAAFFVDANFQGQCVVLGIGDYATATDTRLPNDSISAIRVGTDVQAYVCENENFGGHCSVVRGSHPNMDGIAAGNEAITSIKVQWSGASLPCEPGPLRISIYVDADFGGACKVLAVGDYPTATLTGLPNDSVSSIRVGPGAQVTACGDEYYGGTCVTLTQSTSYLGNTSLGNDHLTSAKVRKLGATDFDARCSDPHATGRFTCRMDQPPVNRAESPMPRVVFSPGDIVYVGGDGCVQTGNHIWSGSTWKRYVNPSGSNADHFYHGLVRIPGGSLVGTDVGNTLTRIERVVGQPIKVLSNGTPTGDMQLHLGYEDDNYDDNNYSEHDDGTEDQCKTDDPNYGGPAFVEITICRGVPLSDCPAPPSRFPFNVRSGEFDPNGFLYNPHWSWQERPEINAQRPLPTPNTSLCHEFSKPGSVLALHWYNEPNLPDCTDQAGTDTLNQPADVSANNLVCSGAPTPVGFSGHINWFPVTVKGHAGRISHDIDDDWDFSFPYEDSSKGSLYYDHVSEKRQYLHAEFDSEETVDNFKSDAWTALHNAMNARESISDQLHACQAAINPARDCTQYQRQSDLAWALADKLFVGDAFITGLFGIDGEHGEKSELHPVYAFASNLCARGEIKNGWCDTANDPSDDPWLMFVRNRGDEGFCSDGTWAGGFDDYTFRLPWKDGMQSVAVNWDKSQFDWNGETTNGRPDIQIVPPTSFLDAIHGVGVHGHGGSFLLGSEGPGVYVTFHLKYPTVLPPGDSSASYPFVDGAIHLVWTPAVAPPPSAVTHSATPIIAVATGATTSHAISLGERDDETDQLDVAVDHLPVAKRQQVLAAHATTLSPPSTHAASPATAALATKGPSRVAGPVGPATRKNARDAALIKALCAASDNKPYGLPPKVCAP